MNNRTYNGSLERIRAKKYPDLNGKEYDVFSNDPFTDETPAERIAHKLHKLEGRLIDKSGEDLIYSKTLPHHLNAVDNDPLTQYTSLIQSIANEKRQYATYAGNLASFVHDYPDDSSIAQAEEFIQRASKAETDWAQRLEEASPFRNR